MLAYYAKHTPAKQGVYPEAPSRELAAEEIGQGTSHGCEGSRNSCESSNAASQSSA